MCKVPTSFGFPASSQHLHSLALTGTVTFLYSIKLPVCCCPLYYHSLSIDLDCHLPYNHLVLSLSLCPKGKKAICHHSTPTETTIAYSIAIASIVFCWTSLYQTVFAAVDCRWTVDSKRQYSPAYRDEIIRPPKKHDSFPIPDTKASWTKAIPVARPEFHYLSSRQYTKQPSRRLLPDRSSPPSPSPVALLAHSKHHHDVATGVASDSHQPPPTSLQPGHAL